MQRTLSCTTHYSGPFCRSEGPRRAFFMRSEGPHEEIRGPFMCSEALSVAKRAPIKRSGGLIMCSEGPVKESGPLREFRLESSLVYSLLRAFL